MYTITLGSLSSRISLKSVCENNKIDLRGRSRSMSSLSAINSRIILSPSDRNPAVSPALIVSSTSAITLVRSIGHRSKVSPDFRNSKPLTVLNANDDRSPVE